MSQAWQNKEETKMSLKVGDKVRTKGFNLLDLMTMGLRNGIKGTITAFEKNPDGVEMAVVTYVEGQEALPHSHNYGTVAAEYYLENLKLDEPMSLEPEQGFYVDQVIRLKDVAGTAWAEGNKVTNGTEATIKGFYTCDHCDHRHIALDVDGREVLGIVFEHIEPVTSKVA